LLPSIVLARLAPPGSWIFSRSASGTAGSIHTASARTGSGVGLGTVVRVGVGGTGWKGDGVGVVRWIEGNTSLIFCASGVASPAEQPLNRIMNSSHTVNPLEIPLVSLFLIPGALPGSCAVRASFYASLQLHLLSAFRYLLYLSV
jgi:hypothetical protein